MLTSRTAEIPRTKKINRNCFGKKRMICNFIICKFNYCICNKYYKIYNNNLYNSLYTYHLLIFNFPETTRAIHCCIFCFVDNGIADTEESSDIFFILPFETSTVRYLSLSELHSSSDPWCSSDLQPTKIQ